MRILMVVILSGFLLSAQSYEEQEAKVQKALWMMYGASHEDAYKLFKEVWQSEPFHVMGPFGTVANEWMMNQGKYGYEFGNKQLLENIDEVLTEYRKQMILDPDNPEYCYFMGLTTGFRARVQLAEKNWFGVMVNGYRIIRYFKRALRENPDNPDVPIAFGVFSYYVGLSSGFMQVASKILRISGTKEEGLQQITEAAYHGQYSRYEARSLLAYIDLYFEGDYPTSRYWLDTLLADFPENLYFNYLMADLCIRTGNPEIDQYTETIQRLYQKSNKYSQVEHIQRLRLLKGSKAFLENDLETAEKELIQYIANYSSEMDYDLASAYLRLGNVYDLMGKRSEAIQQYQKVIDLDNRSHAVLEAQGFIVEPYQRISTD